MLIVETIAKIRRLHFTEGKGIKTICRDLKLSKKVVRKVIRTGITEFTYTRTVQPRPKLGAWLEELSRLLAINAARGRRERLRPRLHRTDTIIPPLPWPIFAPPFSPG